MMMPIVLPLQALIICLVDPLKVSHSNALILTSWHLGRAIFSHCWSWKRTNLNQNFMCLNFCDTCMLIGCLPNYLYPPIPTYVLPTTYPYTYLPIPTYLPLSTYTPIKHKIQTGIFCDNKMNMFAQTWSIIDTHTYTHRLFC